ncbi:rhodanese-like domain-containing protein [Macrococcus animalis]|uniref:rhodanese-like domain-containing protein n=1 Tax=Macrococcus animalis TaxID=3395467 RepID=UPI0039BE2480
MTKTITLDAIQDAINSGSDAQILDVRELDEFKAGHIPEAMNLPLSEIDQKAVELQSDIEYIVICKKGGRAKRAGEYLETQGFNVTVGEQGMDDWKGEVKIED